MILWRRYNDADFQSDQSSTTTSTAESLMPQVDDTKLIVKRYAETFDWTIRTLGTPIACNGLHRLKPCLHCVTAGRSQRCGETWNAVSMLGITSKDR